MSVADKESDVDAVSANGDDVDVLSASDDDVDVDDASVDDANSKKWVSGESGARWQEPGTKMEGALFAGNNKVTTRWEGPQSLLYHKQSLRNEQRFGTCKYDP